MQVLIVAILLLLQSLPCLVLVSHPANGCGTKFEILLVHSGFLLRDFELCLLVLARLSY